MAEGANSVLNLDLTIDVFDRIIRRAQIEGVSVEALVLEVLHQHFAAVSSPVSYKRIGI